MLVLTRRIGEVIKIGDDIEVTILGFKGGQVRVGVKAPKEIDVHRQEIWQRIHKVTGDESGALNRKNIRTVQVMGAK